jgi:large subunit ribosomal protein L18
MSKSKTYTVGFKRKRKGKTNYKKRLNYLKSEKTRITIRTTKNDIIIQAIDFNESGDRTISTLKALDLRKMGWNYNPGNIPSSYLAGLYFGIKNKGKIKESIIDLGLKSITKGNRLSAAIKGIKDSGINISCSEKIFPSENKIDGTSITEYANSLSENKEKYEKQFSKYLKKGLDPKNIKQDFKKIKETIMKNEKETK